MKSSTGEGKVTGVQKQSGILYSYNFKAELKGGVSPPRTWAGNRKLKGAELHLWILLCYRYILPKINTFGLKLLEGDINHLGSGQEVLALLLLTEFVFAVNSQ